MKSAGYKMFRAGVMEFASAAASEFARRADARG